jgi:hypothetical protein
MEPPEIVDLAPGRPVWIWLVRLGKGKWWPGTVQSLRVIDGIPQVTVRFEGRMAEGRSSRTAAFVGISTTRMRFLELRNAEAKGADRPHDTPVALLRMPETPIDQLSVQKLGASALFKFESSSAK